MTFQELLDGKEIMMTRTLAEIQRTPDTTHDELIKIGHCLVHYVNEFEKIKAEDAACIAASAHHALDEMLTAGKERSTDAKLISCARGCSHCCKQYVTVMAPEAEFLVSVAKENGLVLDREKLERQRQLKEGDYSTAPRGDAACVFLQESGECAVYEFRPMSCRKYFSLADPVLCDLVRFPHQAVPTWFDMRAEIIASAAMQVFGAGPMAEELLKALDRKEATT